jgi:hypothetical protein
MRASASSFHHSWLYYRSSRTLEKRNSEADAIMHLQKSLVLLNKQSTGIIQPVIKASTFLQFSLIPQLK